MLFVTLYDDQMSGIEMLMDLNRMTEQYTQHLDLSEVEKLEYHSDFFPK